MADYRVPSQQEDRLSANTFSRPVLHRSHGNEQRIANPHVAGDDRTAVHQEDAPQPVGNIPMQAEMQYPHHIGALRFHNAVHYHPPQPHYPEDPYARMHRDVGAAQGVPAQTHGFAPEVQENHNGLFGYDAQFSRAEPPEALPGVWQHPAPLVNMPPENGLRNLAGRPGPKGHFKMWIALESADIFWIGIRRRDSRHRPQFSGLEERIRVYQ
ncbi:hypothetical protein EDB87DRAFT_675932 [Lactarius vividus]|nr:hypothetical protein EDB87DRAFT_675932 [Lactarius vividus]